MTVYGPWTALDVREAPSYLGPTNPAGLPPGLSRDVWSASGQFILSNSLAASAANIWPSEYADARACVAQHISKGSRGVDGLGSGLNTDWNPGECPSLGVITQYRNVGGVAVGYACDFTIRTAVLQSDDFSMTAGQWISEVSFSSDWSPSSVTLAQLSSYFTAPTIPAGATIEYRIVGLDLSLELHRLGYEADERECTVTASWYEGVWPPTDWVSSAGPPLLSISANGFRTLGITLEDLISERVAIGSYTAAPGPMRILLSSPQVESGIDPGRPSSSGAVNRNCRMVVRPVWVLQWNVEYRFLYSGIPPQRQRQRNDGLTGSSAVRALHRTTSRQSSNRQNGYW